MNEFNMTPEAASKVAIEKGVARVFRERLQEMMNWVVHRGNPNQPKTQPASIIYVVVQKAKAWPVGGSVRVVTSENRMYEFKMQEMKFTIHELKAVAK